MDDLEFCKIIETLHEYMMKDEKNEDYIANPEQLRKFEEVWACFAAAAAENHGTVPKVTMEPKDCHGSIECTFHVFYLNGNLLSRFQKVLGYLSAFLIEELADGFCISAVVPYVYVRKDEKSE